MVLNERKLLQYMMIFHAGKGQKLTAKRTTLHTAGVTVCDDLDVIVIGTGQYKAFTHEFMIYEEVHVILYRPLSWSCVVKLSLFFFCLERIVFESCRLFYISFHVIGK